MKTVRIFISSPGDVQEERETAKQVIQGLRKRYAAYFELKPFLWEYLPLQADVSFQQGVDMVLSTEHGIDVAVFILWSRLGSPLGALILKEDGSEYRSGTEREFDLMLKAREASNGAKPHLLVYTRSDEAGFRERLRSSQPEEKSDLLKQKELVESFIREEFHDGERGTNMRAYHTFNQAASFSSRLRAHLQELLDSECEGLRADPVWDIDEKGPPFRGLRVFEYEHAEVFFGREDEVVESRRSLQESAKKGCAFLLVTGASGSGKSSLARAGILPAIVENEIDDDVRTWRRAIFTPSALGHDAWRGLAELLFEAVPELCERTDRATLSDHIKGDPEKAVTEWLSPALISASKGGSGAVRLVILADQLEELFTDDRFGVSEREKLATFLGALARSGEVWVVATVRGDFYARCQEVEALMTLKADGSQVDVLAPKADAIRRMIESPAALAGLNYERTENATLADLILAEASNQAELLPLLQDLLESLFNRRNKDGLLPLSAYKELGGISGALAKRAEEAFDSLPNDTQESLPLVLKQLIALEDGFDGERGAMRRRAPLSSFPENSRARSLVDVFVKERLLVADQAESGDATLTVAHEALLRVWPRVGRWLDENKEFLRQRSRLAQAMAQWKAQNYHEDCLLARGLPIAQAEDLLLKHGDSLTNEEKAFVQSSQAKAERERKRASRIRTAVLSAAALLVLLAIAGAAAGYIKNSEAKNEKLAAEARQRQAASYYQVHGAQIALEQGDFRGALKRCTEAYERHQDFTTRSALLTALRNSPQRLKTSLTGFGAAVTLLAFAEDGSLAVADAGGAMRVIDTTAETEVIRAAFVPGEKDVPLVRSFSRQDDQWKGWREDGSMLSPASADDAVASAGDPTLHLAVSRDGNFLVAVFPDAPMQAVLRRAIPQSPELARMAAGARISRVCVTEEGFFAAATAAGELIVGDSLGGSRSVPLQMAEGARITSLVWESGSRGKLAVGTSSGEVYVVADGESEGEGIRSIKLEGRITDLAWRFEGERLAVARSDGSVSLLTCGEGVALRELETFRGHKGAVLSLAWSGDATVLASGGEDGTVCLWSPDSWPGPFRSLATGRDLRAMAVSHDGSTLALGGNDGSLMLVAVETLADPQLLATDRSAVSALDWSKTREFVAAGNTGGTLAVWSKGVSQEPDNFAVPGQAFDKTVWRVKWSPNAGTLAYTSHSGMIGLVDAVDGSQRELSALKDYALGLAWSPDGNTLAVGSTDGRIRMWNLSPESSEILFPAAGSGGHADSIGSLAFSPEGRLLASCGNDGSVVLWDVSSRIPQARSTPAGCYLEDVCFDPKGRFVAAVGADGYLRVWSGLDMEPWFAVKDSDKHLWAVSWNQDTLFLTGTDGRVTVIDIRENVWQNRADAIVGYSVGP